MPPAWDDHDGVIQMARCSLAAAVCLAIAAALDPEKFEVPKYAVDFRNESNATVSSSCGPPKRLDDALLARLYFYAFVTSDDPDLLTHFLDFYETRGVRFDAPGRSRIVVNPPLNRTRLNDRRVHRLLTERCRAAYGTNVRASVDWSSDVKRDLANSYLAELPKDSLLMFPDLDEFFDAPPEAISLAAQNYDGFVLGHMVDRVAHDYRLRAMNRHLGPWAQFPRRCAATADRFHAANTKWILVPARDPGGKRVAFTSAHHVSGERRFDETFRRMPSLPFSHYRFGGRSYDLLRRKRAVYKAGANARAHIYDVILSYIDDGARPILNAKFRKVTRCGLPCPVGVPR